jgi:hypothetical protein
MLLIALTTLTNLSAQKWGNYTLYSVQNSTTTQLIDTLNAVYKTWTHTTATKTGYSSYLMPGGILWRSIANTGNSLNGGGMTGRVQKVAWDGTVLWDFTYSSSTYCLHHDFCPLPNGNVLLISYDVKTAAEATVAGCSQNIVIWSEKVIEVQPTGATTGNIVWEWKLWDHLVQNVDASKPNYQTSIVNHPELLNINYSTQKDWVHMNGIDYNPMLDQISLSSHNLNMWFIIDHSTTTAEAASHSGGNAGKGGDMLYRYGNPASYGATGSTVLNVTHDAHWIPEGVPNAGRLVGFNNRGVSNSQSSVDQIDVPRVGYNYTITPGSAYTPATYTQRHACNGASSNMGNSQQLPNGNMLVCIATSGLMYEINSAGTTLWSKTATGSVPQAFRYSNCYVSNPAPAIPTVSQNGNILSSTTAVTYQWYKNGDLISGAISQTYNATQSGVYVVRITDSNGCVYQYSPGFRFTPSSTLAASTTASPMAVCAGSGTQLNASASGGSGSNSYSWSSNPAGFSSAAQNPTVSPTITTTYTVTVSDGSSTATSSVTVSVNSLPTTPIITQNGSTLSSSAGTSYRWFFDGQEIIGATQQTYEPSTNGNYQVEVTDQNGCASLWSDLFPFFETGVAEVAEHTSIYLFPNPTNALIHIGGLNGATENFEVTVIDLVGRKILSVANQKTIDLTTFENGIYQVLIKTNAGETIGRTILLRK